MMSNYLVSICIPAYNHPHLLKRCLESIVNQGYRDFEVIITDDSQHNLLQSIVNDFSDERIKYYKNFQPLGSPENWNHCISKAKGDIVKILHHDDWFFDNTSLEKLVEVFKNNQQVEFVFSQCFNVSKSSIKFWGQSLSTYRYIAKCPSLLLFANFIGAPSTVAMRRNVTELISFDKESSWYVDIIYYIGAIRSLATIEYLRIPLVNITSGSNLQITNTTSSLKKFEEALYAFSKYYDFKSAIFKFLLFIHFIELARKYRIKSVNELALNKFSPANNYIIKLAVMFSFLPVHYTLYALIRLIIIKIIVHLQIS